MLINLGKNYGTNGFDMNNNFLSNLHIIQHIAYFIDVENPIAILTIRYR